jgi:multiple antibiotic resistance protein
MTINTLARTFIPILVAIDIIGLTPIYLSLTEEMTPQEKKDVVLMSLFTALGVSLTFVFVGKIILDVLGVTVADFKIAGGLILLVLSVKSLILGEKFHPVPGDVLGAVPIGVPLIVGPAVLTTILILVDHYGYIPTLISLIINMFLSAFILHKADYIVKLLGRAGTKAVSKITALFLATIAIRMIRLGIIDLLQLINKK